MVSILNLLQLATSGLFGNKKAGSLLHNPILLISFYILCNSNFLFSADYYGFTVATATVAESANYTVTVSCSCPDAGNAATIVVQQHTSGAGTATDGSSADYGYNEGDWSNQSITLSYGSVSSTFDVDINDDDVYETGSGGTAETIILQIAPANTSYSNHDGSVAADGGSTDDDDLELYGKITISITDNDDVPAVYFQTATANYAETDADQTLTVTFVQDRPSIYQTTLQYTVAAGGDADAYTAAAGSGADHTITTATVNIAAAATGSGAQTQTANLAIDGDDLYELDEEFVLTIVNNGSYPAANGSTSHADRGSGSSPEFTTHTGTITDDDAVPSVSFATAQASDINETDGATTITITQSAASGLPTSIPFSAGGTATSGSDYASLTSSPVTIAAGATTTTISVDPSSDATALYDPDETLIITINSMSAGSNYATRSGSNYVYTWELQEEHDEPTVQFTNGGADGSGTGESGNEATTSKNIALTLNRASSSGITIPLTLSGTATAGTDFTQSETSNFSSDFTIAANTAAGTVNIPLVIVNDAIHEAGETIILDMGAVSGADKSTNVEYTYTITNVSANDNAPNIAFGSDASGAEGNSGTSSVTVPVTLSAAAEVEARVNYAVNNSSTGTSGTDYSITEGTLTFTAGSTTPSSALTFTVTGDAYDEASETVILDLSGHAFSTSTSSWVSGTAFDGDEGDNQFTYTITDDDDAPTVSFAEATASVTEGGTESINVNLSAASKLTATVAYTISGTATGTGDTDYDLDAGTLTFSADDTQETIEIPTTGDVLDEVDETVILTLGSYSNCSAGTNTGYTLTITDNDDPPTIEFTAGTSSATEPVDGTATIQIDAASGKKISVPYTMTGTASGGGTDYTLANGTAYITAGETDSALTIDVITDTYDEANETVIITLGSPTNATLGSTYPIHTFTITDNDDAPSIAFPAATNTSTESATPVFVPTLSAASGIDINVSYAVGGTSTATGGGTDYTLADGTATITAGNTSTNVTATINNDALDEDNETIVLTLSNPVYSTSQTPSPSLGTNSTITHTITDDDDSPAIGFSSASSSGAEATTPGTFIVNLSAVSGKDITASYALTGTATGGGTDYTLADGTVTITAGNTADTLSAVITDDYVVEDDETVIVTLSSPTNSTVGTAAHTYTITNDDEGPSAFNYYSIYTDGGTENYNYWNSTNTGLEVKVQVENNTKLVGGTIQVQAKVTEANSYTNIGDAYTIQATDLGKVGWSGGTWYDVVLLPVISAASVEALTPFTELATLYVRVIITDSYGNSTTSSNAKTFTIDQTAPADNTVGAVVSAEGTVVAGYYNSTNTSVDVTVPFDTDDTTLKGGYIQIYSKKSILDTDYWDKIYSCGNSGEFDEADTSTCDSTYNTYIDAAELATGSLNISLTDTGGSYVYYTDAEGTQHKSDPTDFEEANGFAEQANMEFRAVVRDIAGNSTTYTKSSTTLTVDQTPAVLVEVTSSTDDGYYNEGDTIAVTLEFDQVVDVSGAPRIELEIGDPDVKVDYISGTGTNTLTFRYVVSDAHNSDKLAYTDTTAFDLNGATIRDPAGNPLSSLILFKTGATGSLSSNKNLRIDTIAPTCSLTYVNLTQTSLENLGKGDDQIQVIGNFNETVQSTPTLSVVFADPTDVSITGLEFTGSTNSDSTWTYTFTLPTGTSYTGNMTVTPAYFDLAGNALSTLSGATDFEIDNTPPAAFQTGDVVPMGSLPKTGWFNAGTDSLSITIPIQTTDNSLLQGKIQPRMQITTVTGSLADIGPSTTLINIAVPVKEIFVKKADIRSSFSATDFAQGVKLLTNVDLYDRAGNVTVGSLNLDTLVVDTISPVVGSYVTEISGSVAVVDTTLVSSDSLYARWTQFVDNSLLGESGVADYQWAVGRFGSADLDSVQELISAGLDTFLTGKAPLRDSTRYDLSVLAVDSAGNVSQTLQTTTGFYRLNSAPIISTIDTITTKEQVDLSYQVTATDLDLSTLLGDTLHYNFLNNLILQDSLVLLTDSAAAKINTSSGLLTWQTPLHSDTVSYPVTLNVSDEWGRSTNEIFVLTVNANTRPKVSTAPDTVMNEAGRGVNHRSIMEYTFKVHDPDDELVTINAFSDSTQIHVSPSDTIVATTGRDTVDVIFTFEVDSFWTKESKITLSLTDEKLITTETFIIDVLRVARPQMWITFAQNPSFTRFFELMVIDTVGKVNLDTSDVYNLYKPRKEPLILYVYEKQGEVLKPEGEVDLSYIDSYVWVGNFEFDTTSTYCYEMNVIGVVGDTVVTPCTNVVFARARQSWVGSSTDGIFKVNAKSGAVAFDKPFMIVDSLLLYHDEPYDARYRMGHQMVTFEKPVMVSLQADSSLPEEDQAIYQISRDSFWKELPTISKNGELLAWTSNMGYFKIGERTIIVPEETALGSNYPNPFNALTHITFDVGFFGGLEQRVDVSIYNLLGQKVKTVHDDILLIGRHDLVWDGRDTHGVPVSSGIYIVGFSSDGGVRQARKMMLVR